ncbi:MAG: hypothetical protein B5766_00340 [Candidatus Lumbricidophila eiseniae]|uniref:Uncharacterized protein n=1 Tax=Candidatus Lumbricidiphila eiseniae TaxID=1969409 RepID=A0A2A6FV33_9MICO|nr:MAG: hypothetical protein B5766_00340 [Candidatus Lumbricidophila eiseniae]
MMDAIRGNLAAALRVNKYTRPDGSEFTVARGKLLENRFKLDNQHKVMRDEFGDPIYAPPLEHRFEVLGKFADNLVESARIGDALVLVGETEPGGVEFTKEGQTYHTTPFLKASDGGVSVKYYPAHSERKVKPIANMDGVGPVLSPADASPAASTRSENVDLD